MLFRSVLEWHAAEMGGNFAKQMLAWAKPKAARRRLINSIMQLNCNFIFCSRAKPKLRMPPKGSKEEPIDLGYQPIGGDEWMYEMTLNMLMLPRANGVPTWHSEQLGEAALIKLPEQFKPVFADKPQLSEAIGESLARWAAGTSVLSKKSAADLIVDYKLCSEPSVFRTIEEVRGVSWSSLSTEDRKAVKAASIACSKKLEDATKVSEVEPSADDDAFTPTEIPAADAKAAS